MSDVDPRERWVLHFTHLDNLPSIVRAARLACDLEAGSGMTTCDVGDPAVKQLRRRRIVSAGPGGTVGDYVPFYFAPRSPMLYRIACDHRDGVASRYADGDRPLAYLATTVGRLVDAGLRWVATDGNAATATTRFVATLAELDQVVDWGLMTERYWHNTPGDPDRQRRRMAELLVHRSVPLTALALVAVYSHAEGERARAGLGAHPLAERILVRRDWYYGYERR